MRSFLAVVFLCAAAYAQDSVTSFRVRFGVTDTEPRAWDGKLSVKGGELVELRNWRPRPAQHVGGAGWRLSTEKGRNYQKRPWEAEPLVGTQPYLLIPGVIVDVKGSANTSVKFTTKNGSFEVKPFQLAAGQRQEHLNGRILVDWTPTAHVISGEAFQNDFATLLAGPGGELWTGWVAYAEWKNQVIVRRRDGAGWKEAEKISEDHSDIFLVKAGRDGQGGVWFVWSARENENFDLYGRRYAGGKWSVIERLTTEPEPDIYHAMATDSNGNLWLVWQGFRHGLSNIFARRHDGDSWSGEERVSLSAANDWEPAIATDSKGGVFVAWDTYDQGNYDIVVRERRKGVWSEPEAIANTPKFEAHVSLSCDNLGRLWAAWNEAGTQWGKDTGFLLKREGARLYQERWMAVAVRDGKGWKEPARDIEESLPAELRGYNDLPVLQFDNKGRMWVLFRHRRPRMIDTPSDTPMHRAAWEIYATSYIGTQWTTPVAIPFSRGRTDMRIGVGSDERANIYIAWPTDNRDFQDFLFQKAQIYTARIPGYDMAATVVPKLKERRPAKILSFPLHPNEEQDVNRIRGFTIRSEGKSYRIYRGDTHRHTEFSHDGHNDGSLIDTYRYSIDAADLDFVMVSEHNSAGGPDEEYVNWLTQQMPDVLHLPNRFVPLFGYERSIGFPDGHRNVIFSERGNPALPITQDERQHKTGAKRLFEYLKKNNGISIPHTSATGMGTDWRDNDREVEPLVEIYQGDRVSAEYEGAPRAAWGGKLTGAPGNFRPAGFVWNAWAKGYKLGVQASSDHLSTHISYACTIAEEGTREGLLAAMKLRHSYGATDNIILDYRLRDGDREFLQGDIVEGDSRFTLRIRVIGTAPVRRIDIIKNNTFLHTRQPMEQDVEFTFVDTEAERGENYYYVRVQQVDDQIAWSSPIWITVR